MAPHVAEEGVAEAGGQVGQAGHQLEEQEPVALVQRPVQLHHAADGLAGQDLQPAPLRGCTLSARVVRIRQPLNREGMATWGPSAVSGPQLGQGLAAVMMQSCMCQAKYLHSDQKEI